MKDFKRHVLPSDSPLHYLLPDVHDDAVNILRYYEPLHIIRTQTNKFRNSSFHTSFTVSHDRHTSSHLHFLLYFMSQVVLSVLWHCWLGGRKGIQLVKNWVMGIWHDYPSGQGADLHMAQLMPLPLTISCSSKSRLVLPEWFCFSGARLPRLSWKKGR